MEPLTIYECPTCGLIVAFDPRASCVGSLGATHPGEPFAAVRVFREEDVRPLWEGVRELSGTDHGSSDRAQDAAYAIADAFPAPEEWKTGKG